MFPSIFKINLGYLLLLAVFCGCETATTLDSNPSGTSEMVAGTVDLVLDVDGVKQTVVVPCSADSTVFDILVRAQNMQDLEFESHGSGQTAFVTAINGVENQRGNGKNWVFRVNGELADEGCGVLRVRPGDQVEWQFGDYWPEQEPEND